MKEIAIQGHTREHLGKQDAKQLRREAQVPVVLYGGMHKPVHCYVPMAALKPLVYTSDVHFIQLQIADQCYRCILQDMQFHPVSEMMVHADFLRISEDQKINMHIPVVCTGRAAGVAKGGALVQKLRKVPIAAYPKDMPERITVDVTSLDLGDIARVRDLTLEQCEVLLASSIPVASVEIPRALRSATSKAEEEE